MKIWINWQLILYSLRFVVWICCIPCDLLYRYVVFLAICYMNMSYSLWFVVWICCIPCNLLYEYVVFLAICCMDMFTFIQQIARNTTFIQQITRNTTYSYNKLQGIQHVVFIVICCMNVVFPWISAYFRMDTTQIH
jgi:hypothetical protein